MRDLMVYASALPSVGSEPVRYYRDETGLEADAVVELADGSWAAFEFKVSEGQGRGGGGELEEGARQGVLSAKGAQVRPPAFMAVITGNGQFAREAEDGIYVIPIRALGA